MEYELLAFGSKDKEFVKEHGQAAAMFVFLVSLKAAKSHNARRLVRGSPAKLRPSMTWKIQQTRKNMVIIQRLPWVEWRTRVSCCSIPPHHHLFGRMFGQTTSSRKFELLAPAPYHNLQIHIPRNVHDFVWGGYTTSKKLFKIPDSFILFYSQ